MMRRHVLTMLIATAVTIAGCDSGGDVIASGGSANTINGSVHVPAGQHTGAVGTVNGSVDVAENAVVGTVNTVNGPIDIAAHAGAESVAAVNGPITLGSGAHVAQAVTTVNGAISLNNGAEVGGGITNVNGRIDLSGAHVAGGLRTVGGDIDVTGDSRVEGGILVQKTGGSWFGFFSHPRKPRIVIGPGAVVQGDLRFEREVQLYVSDKATVGPISGATPIRFSGDKPPA
jgi:DUF4097 and DUF4098 domain-containing protein YvlB